jgi:nucleotide-binding universal stress UspA family protein
LRDRLAAAVLTSLARGGPGVAQTGLVVDLDTSPLGKEPAMTGKQMTIVCATDFSFSAEAAVKLSGQLAAQFGDRVLAVHVIELPTLLSERTPEVGWEAALREAGEAELRRVARQLDRPGVRAETSLLFGSVSDQLLDQAAQPGVRMMILGTHGRKGASHFFLGSIAESIARKAPCPVVVTRGLPFPDDGLTGKRRLQLLVPVDGSPASESALAWVKQLRGAVPCDVTLFQPFWPPFEAQRFGVERAWVRKQPDPELLPLLERELRRWVGDLPGEGQLRCRFGALREGVNELLANEAELLQPDLVVAGISKRGEGSFTAASVIQSVRTPVVCVPEVERPAPDTRIPWVSQVLVGTDLSNFSNQAVAAAYALLRGTGGLVEICHVVEGGDSSAERRQHLERQLALLAPPEAAALGIVTRVSVVDAGSAAAGLMQAAERSGVDVVVLAAHGRTGVERAVMRSISEVVARQSGRPVMVLHPPAR